MTTILGDSENVVSQSWFGGEESVSGPRSAPGQWQDLPGQHGMEVRNLETDAQEDVLVLAQIEGIANFLVSNSRQKYPSRTGSFSKY